MRHKARDSGGKHDLLLLLCRYIGLLFSKRLDTNLQLHRIRKYLESPFHTLSDSLRIYYFFFTRESGVKNDRIRCRIRRMRLDGSLARKKKLRIQKYQIRVDGFKPSSVHTYPDIF